MGTLRPRPVCPPVERATAHPRFQPGGLVLRPGARRQGSVASLRLAAQTPQRRQSLGASLLAAGGLAAVSRRAPWTANKSRRFPRLGLGVGPVSLVARVGQAPLPRVSRGGRCAEWVCPSWPAAAEQEVSLAQAGCVADTSPRAGRRQRRLTWLLEVAPGLWLGAGSRGVEL